MPYKRGYRKHRKQRRRPTDYMGTASKGLYLAGTALNVARGVKALVNSEKHTYSRTVSASTINSTGSMVELSNISQGDEYTNRQGRSILAKSLELNGWMVQNPSASTTVLRIIIFRDNNADGSTPVSTEVLTSNNTFSLRNPEPHNMKRYQILLDKVYTFDDAKSKIAKFSFYKQMNKHIKFANGANSNQGSLWCYLLSNEPTNAPTVNLNSRIRFYDN